MREIKFRAWDKELNFMINIKRYKIDFDGQVLFDNNDKELYNQTNKIELMQYTGLKDKNDVKIYEGDILKYPYVRSSSVNYTIEIGVIEWSDEYCGFIIDEVQNIGGFCGIESKHMNELEVIGNIYENPELMEEGI